MEISLSLTTWRYGLLIQNIFIMFLDVVFISSGVVLFGGAGSVNGAYIATSLGAFTLLVCFLGCFTALRDSYILSKWYISSGILCLILKAVFMITFIVMKASLFEATNERVSLLWQAEQENAGAMRAVHKQYYCCGWDSPQDYIKDDDDKIPESCCVLDNCEPIENIYTKGCSGVVSDFIVSQSEQLIFTCLALIVLEILSTLNAYYFAKRIISSKQAGPE